MKYWTVLSSTMCKIAAKQQGKSNISDNPRSS